jgi:hypothetical protein
MAQQRAQGNQVGVGAEGFGEQPQAMQGLNPLTVEDIGLVTGGETAGQVAADQAAMDAAPLQNLEQGNPGDTGGFHGNRLDVMFFEPGGDGLQVGGVIAEGTHQLGAFVARHADHDLMRAEVDSGGMRVDPAHRGKETRLAQAGIGLAEFAHWGSSWKERGRPGRFGRIAS